MLHISVIHFPYKRIFVINFANLVVLENFAKTMFANFAIFLKFEKSVKISFRENFCRELRSRPEKRQVQKTASNPPFKQRRNEPGYPRVRKRDVQSLDPGAFIGKQDLKQSQLTEKIWCRNDADISKAVFDVFNYEKSSFVYSLCTSNRHVGITQ